MWRRSIGAILRKGLRRIRNRIERRPVYLLLGMLALGTLAFAWPVSHLEEFRVSIQLGLAALTTLAMLALSYWLFRVDEARSLLWERIAGRFPAFATRRS